MQVFMIRRIRNRILTLGLGDVASGERIVAGNATGQADDSIISVPRVAIKSEH